MFQQRRKYGNKKVVIDGIAFDSKKEANRYNELKLLEAAGEIVGLEMQKRFELIPSQKATLLNTSERPVHYVADFVYTDSQGYTVVEDTKGFKTKDYIIKRKLFKARYTELIFREI